jgi:hypothetical protein
VGSLSNEWLAVQHTDIPVSYLGSRFRKSNQPGATLVADQYFGSLLSRKRDEDATKLREDRELRTYANKLKVLESSTLVSFGGLKTLAADPNRRQRLATAIKDLNTVSWGAKVVCV